MSLINTRFHVHEKVDIVPTDALISLTMQFELKKKD